MYCNIFSYFKVRNCPIVTQHRNHGNIIAFTLWILHDSAFADVIYISPVSVVFNLGYAYPSGVSKNILGGT